MALLGGVLTVIFGGWHIARRQRDRLTIPYGVAIALAGQWALYTIVTHRSPGTRALG